MYPKHYIILATISLSLNTVTLHADIKLPAIFGDHMVLQEALKLPVWGSASPGEKVSVTVANEKATTQANPDGKWRVDLPALPEQASPVTLTVTGKNTLIFNDVLVGDVWICSGQSNMEFTLGGNLQGKHYFGGAANGAAAASKANDPQLRLFIVKHNSSLDPVDDVTGTWSVCSPDSAAPFSAVGYFFGRDLRNHWNHPIGIIGSYWGSTAAQSWTSVSALEKDPELQHYLVNLAGQRANFTRMNATYPARMTVYQTQLAAWNAAVGTTYASILQNWNEQAMVAKSAGQPLPPKPQPSTPAPRQPKDAGAGPPGNLYNGMIAPLIPFGIKGVIWY